MEQTKRSAPKATANPKAPPQLERNSYFIEELMFRNGWSRPFTYRLISHGVLKTYKSGKPEPCNRTGGA